MNEMIKQQAREVKDRPQPSETPMLWQNFVPDTQVSHPVSPKYRYGLGSKEGDRLGRSVDLPHGL